MKTIVNILDESFKRKMQKGWDKIYVLIDIHNTIFKSTYKTFNLYDQEEFFPFAKEALQEMTKRNDICLILWSSSYDYALEKYCKIFLENYISFYFINCNPLEKSNELSDFSRKFYFNVGIDDKFGFDANNDWLSIYNYFKHE